MIKPVLHILLGVLMTAVPALALGMIVLARLRLRLYRDEQWLFAFLLGSACWSGIVFALAIAHLLYKGAFIALAAIALLAAWRFGRLAPPPTGRPPLPPFWKWLFWCAWVFFGSIYFCYAMAPEWSPDGSTYHLGLVAALVRAHRFLAFHGDFYKNMPAGLEMLFVSAFAFGRHSAAAMVHFLFLLALPLLIVSFGRRFGFPAAGVFAALLVFASPVTGIDGTSAYVDIGLTTVLFAVFYLIQIWDAEGGGNALAAAGILAGFAFAVKYTGAAGLLYAVLFIAWKRRRASWKLIALIASVAALWILPWTIKSWLIAGNPVTPFLGSLFPNPYVHISMVDSWTLYLRHYNLSSLWRIPIEVTVRGATQGILGPVFLLAPLGLLALRRAAGRRILFCAAIFLLPYFGNIGTRFLLPAAPLAALAMGLVFAAAGSAAAIAVVCAHLALSFPPSVFLYRAGATWNFAAAPPFRAAFRLISEEAWLSERMPGYLIDRMIELHVPKGEEVFSTGQEAEDYTTRQIQAAFLSARAEVLQDALFTALVPDYQPAVLVDFQFPEQPLRAVRVTRTSAWSGMWSVSEFRLFASGKEVPRKRAWLLRANPNPWEAPFAFDNNLATRWRSWQPAKKGMFLEVDFAPLVSADQVRLETSTDQDPSKLKLQTRDASGAWRDLPAALHTQSRPLAQSLRRSATAEIKREGYNYLLVTSGAYGHDDYRRNPIAWGLEPIDEKWDACLYRIK